MQTGLNSEIFSQLKDIASSTLSVKIDDYSVIFDDEIPPWRVLIGALSALL